MTVSHNARMAGKKAVRAALEPGFAEVLPSANAATGWNNLNRAFRRRSIAIAQSGRNGKRSLRKHAASVQYWRGVKLYGVCPTRARPCDVAAYAAETDGAVEELING